MGPRGEGIGEPGSPPPGFARRFALGALYVGMSGWGTSFFRVGAAVVLARLLGPEILGFYAFVFSVHELLGIIGGFSLGLALIQSARTSPEHEDTAIVLASSLGVIAGIVALALAPWLVAERGAQAGWLLGLLALARLVTLPANVVLATLERRLQYRSVAVIQAASGIVPALLALALAFAGAGIWALLAQDLLLAALLFSGAMIRSGYRYRGRFDRGVARDLFVFGRGVFASRALEIGLQRIDRLVVGAFLGDARLGLYHQGRVLAETGLVVERPLERVALNLFARLQHDADALARAFAVTQFLLVRLMFVGAAVLLVAPEAVVSVLLGEAWLPAAPLLFAMALHAALAPILANSRQLLYGRGRVGQAVWVRAVQLLTFLPGLAAAIALDDVGVAAFALTGSTALAAALTLWFNRDVAGPALRRNFAAPLAALAVSLTLHLDALSDALASLPTVLIPVAPVLVFTGALWILERRPLTENFQALRALLAQSES